jgi:hypothetical protein
MIGIGENVAAVHHVAICDKVSHRLSQAATLGFMQYNTGFEAIRWLSAPQKFGTGLAEMKRTSGPRFCRMQQGTDQISSRRSAPSNNIENNF